VLVAAINTSTVPVTYLPLPAAASKANYWLVWRL